MAPSDYPNRPLIGVGIIAFKGTPGRDERVLLIQRGKPPRVGAWSLPGGRQRLGETVRETAVREIREEAGLEVAIGPLLDVVDSMTRDEAGALRFHYTLVDFLAEWQSGEPRPGGDAMGAAWVDPDDLDRFDLWSETLRIIELGRKIRAAGADDVAAHMTLREAAD